MRWASVHWLKGPLLRLIRIRDVCWPCQAGMISGCLSLTVPPKPDGSQGLRLNLLSILRPLIRVIPPPHVFLMRRWWWIKARKPKWKPANYTKILWPSIMRVGIEKSRNLMTARLAMAVGMPMVQDYARKFGINTDLPPFLSMSLGAGETTLLKLTAAYGQLVNGGRKIDVSLIDRIQDRFGQTIMRHDKRDCSACDAPAGWDNQNVPALNDLREQLTDPASAYQMVSMLEGVITRGTGRRIADAGLVVAGKTGTTNDNTNAWFVGFSPDLVAGVYVGYDTPRPLGKRETGSTAAVPIFKQFMVDALAGQPLIPFRRSGGITLVPVHAETGERVLPDHEMAVLEVFKPGQRPKSTVLIDMPSSPSRSSTVDAPALY